MERDKRKQLRSANERDIKMKALTKTILIAALNASFLVRDLDVNVNY